MHEFVSSQPHEFARMPISQEPYFPERWYAMACADRQTTLVLPQGIPVTTFTESLQRYGSDMLGNNTYFFSSDLSSEKTIPELQTSVYKELLWQVFGQAIELFALGPYEEKQFTKLSLACVLLVNQLDVIQRGGERKDEGGASQSESLTRYVSEYLFANRHALSRREMQPITQNSQLAACKLLLHVSNAVADRLGGVVTQRKTVVQDISMLEGETATVAHQTNGTGKISDIAKEEQPFDLRQFVEAESQKEWHQSVIESLGFDTARFVIDGFVENETDSARREAERIHKAQSSAREAFSDAFTVTAVVDSETATELQSNAAFFATYVMKDYMAFMGERMFGSSEAAEEYIRAHFTAADSAELRRFVTDHDVLPQTFVRMLQVAVQSTSKRHHVDAVFDAELLRTRVLFPVWLEQEGFKTQPDEQS